MHRYQYVKVKIIIANMVLQDFKKAWCCAILKYNWFVVEKIL